MKDSVVCLIYTGNTAASKRAQEMLFKYGFEWSHGGKEVQFHLAETFLKVEEDGGLSWLPKTGYGPNIGYGGINVEQVSRLPVLIASNMTEEDVAAIKGAKKPIREVTMEEVYARFGEKVAIKSDK